MRSSRFNHDLYKMGASWTDLKEEAVAPVDALIILTLMREAADGQTCPARAVGLGSTDQIETLALVVSLATTGASTSMKQR